MAKTAVYFGTRNLYFDMIPSLKSLLMHSDVEKVYLVIEDDTFPLKLPDCVEAVNVKNQQYFTHGGPNWKSKWTWMTMMKAALPFVFPNLDIILSLDPDTIVVDDISDLWGVDLTGKCFAAAVEPDKSKDGKIYTNVGVCLFNLKEMRNSGKADEVVRQLNIKKFEFLEQDCLNKLCAGRIAEMPSEYNSNEYVKKTRNPKIIHYAGKSNWNLEPLVLKYRYIPWSEIRGGLCIT